VIDSAKIELRNLRVKDYEELKISMVKSYQAMPDEYWSKGEIRTLVNKFPEGQLCIVIDNRIAGCALSIIVDYNKFDDTHNYEEIIGGENFSTHAKNGNVLYGIDVFIHPEFRGMRLGRRLYEARKELCEHLNLKAIIFGGRIPNFSKYADELTPKKYIDKVKLQEIHDPVLSFQLKNDFHVKKSNQGISSRRS